MLGDSLSVGYGTPILSGNSPGEVTAWQDSFLSLTYPVLVHRTLELQTAHPAEGQIQSMPFLAGVVRSGELWRLGH